jgi:hypothetical protein
MNYKPIWNVMKSSTRELNYLWNQTEQDHSGTIGSFAEVRQIVHLIITVIETLERVSL